MGIGAFSIGMLLAADPYSVIGDQLVVSEKANQTIQKQTVSFIIQHRLSLSLSSCLHFKSHKLCYAVSCWRFFLAPTTEA